MSWLVSARQILVQIADKNCSDVLVLIVLEKGLISLFKVVFIHLNLHYICLSEFLLTIFRPC